MEVIPNQNLLHRIIWTKSAKLYLWSNIYDNKSSKKNFGNQILSN